MKIGPPSLKLS